MLNFKNISKNYKTIKALKDITFSIPENSIFGILGANGSGKSTFMKILPGLIYDWSGEIYYEDRLLTKNDMILRHDFGYLIESPTFYEYLSARKNLEILSRVSNVNFKRIDYVLDLVELSKRSLDKVSAYSYGMKQRLGIAQALLHDPKILVLDEPNNGLDPNGINDMIRLIKNLKSEGKTICLSTHNLKDVEELCTDFTVFKDGLCSNSASLSDQFIKSRRWVLSVKNPTLAISQIKQSDSFEYINSFNDNILIESKTNDTINSMNALLQDNEIYKISKESNLIEYF
jgi:ABC-type multidrug transport system ATPase subunit